MKTSFYYALYKTFHAQKNVIRPGRIRIGLSVGQPKILTFLVQNGPCLQKDLAAAFDIEPATVSRILNNMEHSGLVERTRLTDCRRAIQITITPKGQELQKQWVELCTGVEKIGLAGFTEEETEQYKGFLARTYHNLTNQFLD